MASITPDVKSSSACAVNGDRCPRCFTQVEFRVARGERVPLAPAMLPQVPVLSGQSFAGNMVGIVLLRGRKTGYYGLSGVWALRHERLHYWPR